MVTEKKMTKCINIVSILTILLEGIFLFGIQMGMPNFVDLCRKNGIYQELCSNSNETTTVGCVEQNKVYSNLSTIVTVAQNASVLVIGIIYDRYGTCLSRILCILLVTTGSLLLAYGKR